MDRGVIVLRGSDSERLVPRDHVFFPFFSGSLDYDCVTCGAECCRGHGFFASRQQTALLIQRRPAIQLFMNDSNGSDTAAVRFRTLKPGCFFLGTDGACRIHASEGYQAKPELCKLFPFSSLRLVGDYLVVAPHERLCPLQVLVGVQSKRSDHRVLIEQLEIGGYSGHVHEVGSSSVPIAEAMALEKDTLSLSAGCMDRPYHDLLTAHIRITDALDLALLRCEDPSERLQETESHMRRILRAWPSEASRLDPRLARTFVAVSGIIRIRLRFHRLDARSDYPVTARRLPHTLDALAVVAALCLDAGISSITYQSISTLLDEFRPLVWLLGHSDLRVGVRQIPEGHVREDHRGVESTEILTEVKSRTDLGLGRPVPLSMLFQALASKVASRSLVSANSIAARLLALVQAAEYVPTRGSARPLELVA